MSISTTDLKIFQAQRNRDTADGGGAMSPNEVIDGEINNVFDDISSEDRVGGRVSIRKVFPGVFSNNTDRFFGAGLLIINPAEDPAVDVLMTRSTAYDDERAAVVNRIQSYLIPGATIPWRLFNDHLQGTGALTLFAISSANTPDLGDTLFLEDRLDPSRREAVRVQQIISRSTQEFNDGQPFQRDVLVIQLSRPLQQDWDGTEVLRETTVAPPTRLRSSTISAGARYFGVKQVTEDIDAGDLAIRVANPFSRVVPSTSSEAPLADERATLSAVSFTQAGNAGAIVVNAGSVAFTAGVPQTIHAGGTVLPGSVDLSGGLVGEDRGDGTIEISGSTTAAVDYSTGAITITRQTTGSVSITITATPAAALQDSTLTTQILVTPQNRTLNYIRTLRPLPAPGTVAVDYRALDNWFRLRDNGRGQLVGGQPGEGGGTINYATGTVTASLAALPDLDTTIIFSWGTPEQVSDASGTVSADQPEIIINLSQSPVEPGSVEIEYLSGATTINLEDDGTGGIVPAGGGSELGRIIYGTGEIGFRPTSWPNPNAAITVDYETSAQESELLTPTPTGGSDTVSFTLADAPVRPGSFQVSYQIDWLVRGRSASAPVTIIDDGSGGLVRTGFQPVSITGSINYTTGVVTFDAATTVATSVPTFNQFTSIEVAPGITWMAVPVFTGYATQTQSGRFLVGGSMDIRYQTDSAATTVQQDSVSAPEIRINLLPRVTDSIVPGSVRFTLNGRTYLDRAGDLVFGASPLTNAGTPAGSINYSTGIARLSNWQAGSNEVNVIGLGSRFGEAPTSTLFFRTPAAPISQGSLSVRANRMRDGALIQATADNNGLIATADVRGFVDFENGIVAVQFGQTVTAAGNEAEWWYDAEAVDGSGNIFRPDLIVPGSAFFNAVALVSIPLDPGILGLDPILLPSDGRVPVFRSGDSLMIVQRAVAQDSSPTAGGIVDTGINNISWVRVRDDNGEEVLSDRYTVNGPDGEIQWANPLDLGAYTAPFTVEALAYFKRLATDVQINGQISIASGAPYAMSNSDGQIFLCSKLIFQPEGGNQDLQALVTNLFTQATWTSVWSNSPIGSPTTGQYDDVNNPIEMSNNGSITERWRVQFVTATTVNVIGERFGQLLTGVPIANDIAPINPATSTPYFTIKAAGWSGGWATGNVVRFNTLGANDPVWFIRSTQPGDAPAMPTDRFIAHLQGDTALEAN